MYQYRTGQTEVKPKMSQFRHCFAALPPFGVLLALALLGAACSTPGPQVCFAPTGSGRVCVTIEVARTPAQRRLGLMYRHNLDAHAGMLFVFEDCRVHPFTMRNTFIPLDIIFFDEARAVVGWLENTPPLTEGPFRIDHPSRYALEVNAFFCRDHGISVGDRAEFVDLPAGAPPSGSRRS